MFSLLLIVVLLCAGCYERKVRDPWAEWAQEIGADVADNTGQPDAQRDVQPAQLTTGYAILLRSFTGRDHQRQAGRLVDLLSNRVGLGDVWMMQQGEGTNVYRGRYMDRMNPTAHHDLLTSRHIEIEGVRAFEEAQIVSLEEQAKSAMNPFDLRTQFGENLFTLQAGFFDTADRRQQAEAQVKQLREQGHEAYFYHGPNRSLVTVGIFTDSDFVRMGTAHAYGPRVKEAQQVFPNNLANGRTIMDREAGQDIGAQPSFLVRVPSE